MLNAIIKDLLLWLYSLFIDLIAFCAESLLKIMNTDLEYFENNVPQVMDMYEIFVAIGWGLLIGNCIFQALRIMLAGLGFETESPAILLMRTFLYGFLLYFSFQICDVCLSIGGKIIKLIGIPDKVDILLPDDSFFAGLNSAWLLIVIVGLIIGIQLIKLFFEIGERYAVIAIMTLFSPLAFAMGGSKSTKDICSGFIRTYASMILLLISNIVFLKLILSAMGTMPNGAMVLPWTLLIVGLSKTARKADNLLSKIGLHPVNTGDPLGNGGGRMAAVLAARQMMYSAAKRSGAKTAGKTASNATHNSSVRNGANRSTGNNTSYNRNIGKANNTQSNNQKSATGQTQSYGGGTANSSAFGGNVGNSINNTSTNRFGTSGRPTANKSSVMTGKNTNVQNTAKGGKNGNRQRTDRPNNRGTNNEGFKKGNIGQAGAAKLKDGKQTRAPRNKGYNGMPTATVQSNPNAFGHFKSSKKQANLSQEVQIQVENGEETDV